MTTRCSASRRCTGPTGIGVRFWAGVSGSPRRSESLIRGSLALSNNVDFVGWCHWGLGWIALLEDHLNEVATELHASLQLGEVVDDQSLRAHVSSALALVAALRGDYETARTMAAQAVRNSERMVGAPRVLMMALARAGQVAILNATSPLPPLPRVSSGCARQGGDVLGGRGTRRRRPRPGGSASGRGSGCSQRQPVAPGGGRGHRQPDQTHASTPEAVPCPAHRDAWAPRVAGSRTPSAGHPG